MMCLHMRLILEFFTIVESEWAIFYLVIFTVQYIYS